MKKFKLLLMTAVLAVALCACGGGENEASGESSEKAYATEQESTISTENKNDAESSSNIESVSAEEDEFTCLPELLEASPEDRLMQIGNSIIARDYSMSLAEAVTALENCGIDLTFTNCDGTEFNIDRLVTGGQMVEIYACKDGKQCFFLGGLNYADETTKASDSVLKLETIWAMDAEVMPYVYYCRGGRMDGNGLDYNSVKELFADYGDAITEEGNGNTVVISVSYPGTTLAGASLTRKMQFQINASDSSCVTVTDSTY